MKKMIQYSSLMILMFITSLAKAQQDGPPIIDPLQTEIDATNDWYNSGSTVYQFNTSFVTRNLDSQTVEVGIDVQDNTLLTNLLTVNNVGNAQGTMIIYDTTYFVGNNDSETFVYTRYAQYVCERKLCTNISSDGDVFVNTPVYRIHEISQIVPQDSTLPWVWNNDIYYYAIPDTGTHIVSTLIYWTETDATDGAQTGYNGLKYLQNVRSINTYRLAQKLSVIGLTVSPVPCKDNAHISITTMDAIPDATLTLTNMEGRLVRVESLGAISAQYHKELDIDVSSLPSGIYTLHLSGTAVSQVKKLVVAH